MDNKRKIATLPDWIRDAITKRRQWIEVQLGVGLDEVLAVRVDNNFTSIAARQMMQDVPLVPCLAGPTAELRGRALSVQFPEGVPPVMSARMKRERRRSCVERRNEWQIVWGDTPVALRFEELRGAVIAFDLPYSEGEGTRTEELILCRQDEVSAVMELARQSNILDNTPTLRVGHTPTQVCGAAWENLTLSPEVIRLVQQDFETFFQREDWFRSLNLPFRRGYLFHGQPGNGKTSVIRVMLSRPGLRGFTLNFCSPNTDDDDLQNMFALAADDAPALIVLEDIDRLFPKHSMPQTKVSLQQLLNCLDGVGTQDGVLVAATANDATALDPAILRRPGRFDRVVEFPNPEAELRLHYFQSLNPRLDPGSLSDAVAASSGMSFAQLREAYVLAGQTAFDEQREIVGTDLQQAAKTLQQVFKSRRVCVAGFAPPDSRRDWSLHERLAPPQLEEEPIPF